MISAYSNSWIPKREHLFAPFVYCEPKNIWAVFLGESPYRHPKIAIGSAFALPKDRFEGRTPHSIGFSYHVLRETLQTFGVDWQYYQPDLEALQKSGVLLLNVIWMIDETSFEPKEEALVRGGVQHLLMMLFTLNPSLKIIAFGNKAGRILKDCPGSIQVGHPASISYNHGPAYAQKLKEDYLRAYQAAGLDCLKTKKSIL